MNNFAGRLLPMKKIITVVAVAAAAVTSMTVLGACSEAVSDTGNKLVSSAKSYLQSEAGFDGDLSKLGSDAKSYLEGELGLNNASAKLIEGTWTQKDETNGYWEWTFDGNGKCSLKGRTTGFSGSGVYSVDETAKTVKVSLDSWDSEKVYTYKIRQTLSDTMMDLEASDSSYHLKKNK